VADQLTEGRAPETGAFHLRPDEIAPSLSREQVMACAPDTDGVFFRVPKVIER
jgi:aspartyl-tRNA(Asn)/glutamyl-tRNA(Gln) amidotransferase subunit C